MNLYDVHAFMQVRIAARRIEAATPEAAIAAFEESPEIRAAASEEIDATDLLGPISDVVFQHEEPSTGFTVDLVGRVDDPAFDRSENPEEYDYRVDPDGSPVLVTHGHPDGGQTVLLRRCGYEDLIGREWSVANIADHIRRRGPVGAVHAAVLEAMGALDASARAEAMHDLACDLASVRHGLARLEVPGVPQDPVPLDQTDEFP